MSNAWFHCLQPLSDPSFRLVCFPHAGGGAGLFHGWPRRLADFGIEVWAAQLPGRENRIHSTPVDNMTAAIDQLAAHLPLDASLPLAFFGHSLGALLAFELARYCQRIGAKEPDFLLLAAAVAPHLPAPKPHIHALPRQVLLNNLENRYGGIPPEVATHTELLDLLLPMLRADLHLYETYDFRPGPPLSCPFILIGGLDDASLSRSELNAWRQYTSGAFELHLLPGGHFFVQEEEAQLLALLIDRLPIHHLMT